MPSSGSTNDRGYDYAHKKLRKQVAPQVDAGLVDCWRCNQRITKGESWDLGHDDDDRTHYRGPEHVACNRATAGRHTVMNGPPCDTSRLW